MSVLTARKLTCPSLIWPTRGRSTVSGHATSTLPASIVKRSMWVWVHWRCTFAHTRFHVCASFVERPSPGPGYFRDTFALTQVRNHSRAPTAVVRLLTAQIFGLIYKPTLRSRNISAETALKPSPGYHYWPSMRRLGAVPCPRILWATVPKFVNTVSQVPHDSIIWLIHCMLLNLRQIMKQSKLNTLKSRCLLFVQTTSLKYELKQHNSGVWFGTT